MAPSAANPAAVAARGISSDARRCTLPRSRDDPAVWRGKDANDIEQLKGHATSYLHRLTMTGAKLPHSALELYKWMTGKKGSILGNEPVLKPDPSSSAAGLTQKAVLILELVLSKHAKEHIDIITGRQQQQQQQQQQHPLLRHQQQWQHAPGNTSSINTQQTEQASVSTTEQQQDSATQQEQPYLWHRPPGKRQMAASVLERNVRHKRQMQQQEQQQLQCQELHPELDDDATFQNLVSAYGEWQSSSTVQTQAVIDGSAAAEAAAGPQVTAAAGPTLRGILPAAAVPQRQLQQQLQPVQPLQPFSGRNMPAVADVLPSHQVAAGPTLQQHMQQYMPQQTLGPGQTTAGQPSAVAGAVPGGYRDRLPRSSRIPLAPRWKEQWLAQQGAAAQDELAVHDELHAVVLSPAGGASAAVCAGRAAAAEAAPGEGAAAARAALRVVPAAATPGAEEPGSIEVAQQAAAAVEGPALKQAAAAAATASTAKGASDSQAAGKDAAAASRPEASAAAPAAEDAEPMEEAQQAAAVALEGPAVQRAAAAALAAVGVAALPAVEGVEASASRDAAATATTDAFAAAAGLVPAAEDAAAAAGPAIEAADAAADMFLTAAICDDEDSDLEIVGEVVKPESAAALARAVAKGHAERLTLLRGAAALLSAVQHGLSDSQLQEVLLQAVQQQAGSNKEAAYLADRVWRLVAERCKNAGKSAYLLVAYAGESSSKVFQPGPFAVQLLQQSPRVFDCMPVLAECLQQLLNQRGLYWEGRKDTRQLNFELLLRACNAAAGAGDDAGRVQPFELADVQAAAEVCGLLW